MDLTLILFAGENYSKMQRNSLFFLYQYNETGNIEHLISDYDFYLNFTNWVLIIFVCNV